MEQLIKLLSKHDLVMAFLVVGLIMYVSYWVSKKLTGGKIPGAAIAITAGLVLAYFGGKKGIADFPLFAGMAVLGGSMMRDFSIVSTAMGASISEIKKTGWIGVISLLLGISAAFFIGGMIGYVMGYHDIKSVVTIGAGACTFIVGPVTGNAIGASSDVIAISIAIGVVKSVLVTVMTPFVAKKIGLNNPQTAMIYGGLIGTTSGVAAGLAATDPKLVPYGALTATFYTGLACLLCPSVLYFILSFFIAS
ncbi:MAG: malonate transporter subunit MadM [Chitinophagia bacterium]|jgi:malonate transporter MadM subunit